VLFEPVANELPLVAYESTLDGGISRIDYVIETGEAERIAVDGASKGMEEDQGESMAVHELMAVGHLTTQRNAITMLVDRVEVLRDYVQRVQGGKATADHAVLRQISALTAQLPLVDVDAFASELQSVRIRIGMRMGTNDRNTRMYNWRSTSDPR
jgi:COP9 signalosome complex subunit 6